MQKSVKIVIIVLAVFLLLSVLALTGMLLYNFHSHSKGNAVVPDNIITPETEASSTEAPSPTQNTTAPAETSAPTEEPWDINDAIYLWWRRAEDNTRFQVTNMFPGDALTQYYCLHVSHKADVTVRFHADIRPGYEKLAEVLKCRVVLLTTGQTMYDGLMRDMPSALRHRLQTDESTTSELYYAITAYLDTSVGNEYQMQELKADFRWWVEETDNLEPPKTGESNIVLYAAAAVVVSALVLILLLKKRPKKETEDEQ